MAGPEKKRKKKKSKEETTPTRGTCRVARSEGAMAAVVDLVDSDDEGLAEGAGEQQCEVLVLSDGDEEAAEGGIAVLLPPSRVVNVVGAQGGRRAKHIARVFVFCTVHVAYRASLMQQIMKRENARNANIFWKFVA